MSLRYYLSLGRFVSNLDTVDVVEEFVLLNAVMPHESRREGKSEVNFRNAMREFLNESCNQFLYEALTAKFHDSTQIFQISTCYCYPHIRVVSCCSVFIISKLH